MSHMMANNKVLYACPQTELSPRVSETTTCSVLSGAQRALTGLVDEDFSFTSASRRCLSQI